MLALDGNPQLIGQDRVYLQFALGKAFEDEKDYERSFHHSTPSNASRRAQAQSKNEGTHQEVLDQIEACGPELFHSTTGCPDPVPIFIVGLPRAGSTLLEQILSSHSQIDGTMELPNVLSLSGKLRRRGRKKVYRSYGYSAGDQLQLVPVVSSASSIPVSSMNDRYVSAVTTNPGGTGSPAAVSSPRDAPLPPTESNSSAVTSSSQSNAMTVQALSPRTTKNFPATAGLNG